MACLSLSGTVTRDWFRILKPPAVCSKSGIDGWMDGNVNDMVNDEGVYVVMLMCVCVCSVSFVCFSLSNS